MPWLLPCVTDASSGLQANLKNQVSPDLSSEVKRSGHCLPFDVSALPTAMTALTLAASLRLKLRPTSDTGAHLISPVRKYTLCLGSVTNVLKERHSTHRGVHLNGRPPKTRR